MVRFQVVCQIGFLERLFEEISAVADNFQNFLQDDLDASQHLTQLYRLLHKNSEIHVDYDHDSLIKLAQHNPYFKSLLKTNRLKPSPADFVNLHKTETTYFQNLPCPSTLFLLQKPETECQTLEQRYGYIVISDENIGKVRFLFNFLPQSLTKKAPLYTDWSFMKPFQHPFNAMVIADNYILKDSEQVRQNLLPFLKTVMPNELSANTFHLTILTLDISNIKYIHEEIKKYLSNTFTYNVQLCIVQVADDPRKPNKPMHDRNIITNYFWMSSGYGFSVFKAGKIDKDTHLTVFSMFYLTVPPTAYNLNTPKPLAGQYAMAEMSATLITIYKQIHDSRPETIGMVTYVCGPRQNRLLA